MQVRRRSRSRISRDRLCLSCYQVIKVSQWDFHVHVAHGDRRTLFKHVEQQQQQHFSDTAIAPLSHASFHSNAVPQQQQQQQQKPVAAYNQAIFMSAKDARRSIRRLSEVIYLGFMILGYLGIDHISLDMRSLLTCVLLNLVTLLLTCLRWWKFSLNVVLALLKDPRYYASLFFMYLSVQGCVDARHPPFSAGRYSDPDRVNGGFQNQFQVCGVARHFALDMPRTFYFAFAANQPQGQVLKNKIDEIAGDLIDWRDRHKAQRQKQAREICVPFMLEFIQYTLKLVPDDLLTKVPKDLNYLFGGRIRARDGVAIAGAIAGAGGRVDGGADAHVRARDDGVDAGASAKTKIEAETKRADLAEHKVMQLKADLLRSENSAKNLQAQLLKLRESEDKEKKQASSYFIELGLTKGDLDKLTKELKDKTDEVTKLTKLVSDHTQSLERSKQALATATKNYEDLKTTGLDSQQAMINKLQEELSLLQSVKYDHEVAQREKAQLQEDKRALEEQLNEAKAKYQQLEIDHQKLGVDYQNLVVDYQNLDANHLKLDASYQKLTADYQELDARKSVLHCKRCGQEIHEVYCHDCSSLNSEESNSNNNINNNNNNKINNNKINNNNNNDEISLAYCPKCKNEDCSVGMCKDCMQEQQFSLNSLEDKYKRLKQLIADSAVNDEGLPRALKKVKESLAIALNEKRLSPFQHLQLWDVINGGEESELSISDFEKAYILLSAIKADESGNFDITLIKDIFIDYQYWALYLVTLTKGEEFSFGFPGWAYKQIAEVLPKPLSDDVVYAAITRQNQHLKGLGKDLIKVPSIETESDNEDGVNENEVNENEVNENEVNENEDAKDKNKRKEKNEKEGDKEGDKDKDGKKSEVVFDFHELKPQEDQSSTHSKSEDSKKAELEKKVSGDAASEKKLVGGKAAEKKKDVGVGGEKKKNSDGIVKDL